MFIVLFIVAAGIAIGRLLRSNKHIAAITNSTPYFVYLLLLILGVEVGANQRIMSNLPTLGTEALILTAGATLGSCIAAWTLYTLIWKRRLQ